MTRHHLANTIELDLFNRPGAERIAMTCAGAFAKLAGCPSARIEDLKTVVAEATDNAVTHGNRQRPDGRVKVSIRLEDGAIHVAVTDEGNGLEREVPDPDFDRILAGEAPPAGIGIFLMRRLSDRLAFEPLSKGGHIVRITVRCH
jgi:serine/threonine-protein kinase RsbW